MENARLIVKLLNQYLKGIPQVHNVECNFTLAIRENFGLLDVKSDTAEKLTGLKFFSKREPADEKLAPFKKVLINIFGISLKW